MKKVTFNEDKNIVHILVTWNFAYNLSRKRYWEIAAIDRMRFYRRIETVANIINPILDSNHRCKVYVDRFLNEIYE